MPLSTMSACMLALAALTGLIDGTLASIKCKKRTFLAVLFLSVMMGDAAVEVSNEFKLVLSAALTMAACVLLIIKTEKQTVYKSIYTALGIGAYQFVFTRLLSGDAAVLLSSAIMLAVAFMRVKPQGALFVAAASPLVAAFYELLYSAVTIGYGVFDASAYSHDLQMMGALFFVFVTECRALGAPCLKNTENI